MGSGERKFTPVCFVAFLCLSWSPCVLLGASGRVGNAVFGPKTHGMHASRQMLLLECFEKRETNCHLDGCRHKFSTSECSRRRPARGRRGCGSKWKDQDNGR